MHGISCRLNDVRYPRRIIRAHAASDPASARQAMKALAHPNALTLITCHNSCMAAMIRQYRKWMPARTNLRNQRAWSASAWKVEPSIA
jgi:hypothetical protein